MTDGIRRQPGVSSSSCAMSRRTGAPKRAPTPSSASHVERLPQPSNKRTLRLGDCQIMLCPFWPRGRIRRSLSRIPLIPGAWRSRLVHRPTPLLSRPWIAWRRPGLPTGGAGGRRGGVVPIALAYSILSVTPRPTELCSAASRAHDPAGLHLVSALPAIPRRHLFRNRDIAADRIAGGTRPFAILAARYNRCAWGNETSHYRDEAAADEPGKDEVRATRCGKQEADKRQHKAQDNEHYTRDDAAAPATTIHCSTTCFRWTLAASMTATVSLRIQRMGVTWLTCVPCIATSPAPPTEGTTAPLANPQGPLQVIL